MENKKVANILLFPFLAPLFVRYKNPTLPLAMTLVSFPVWYFGVFQIIILLFGHAEINSQKNTVALLALGVYYLSSSIVWYCVAILTIFYARVTIKMQWDKDKIVEFLKGEYYD